ncbi:MAG: uncharacterized protein K0R25_750 [Rickettsiaceae bacterium]|jgi:ankyrin repeat protein|nr:uncharacterized protein [Rickettsiaceae bacterium]
MSRNSEKSKTTSWFRFAIFSIFASSLSKAETQNPYNEALVDNDQNVESFAEAVRGFRQRELVVEGPTSSLLASQEIVDVEEFFKSSSVFEENKEYKEEDHLASHVNSVAGSAVQTVSNVMNWLSERESDEVVYDMVLFTTMGMAGIAGKSSIIPAIAGGLLSSAFTPADAVMIGDRDYRVGVYCGPKVNCTHLREEAKSKKIELVEIDQGKLAKKIELKEVEIFIIHAHANKYGLQKVDHGPLMRPDKLAAKVSPNSLGIHAIGCKIGNNPQQNFNQNSLKSGQVLFLHAGDEDISNADGEQTSSFLVLEPNLGFPSTIPLRIILKHTTSRKISSIFAELLPVPLSRLASSIENVGELYDVIRRHIALQKEASLQKFSVNPKSQSFITSQIERLGFRDFAVDINMTTKRNLVRNYLWHSCYSIASHKNISFSELEDLESIIGSGLVNVDQTFGDKVTIVRHVVENGHPEYLKVLLENRANPNKADNEGITPLYIAAEKGDIECVKILAKKTDLNKASKSGATPLLIAIQSNHSECVDILLESGADPYKTDMQGASPASMAVYAGHYECLEVLAKNRVNFNKVTSNATPLFIAMKTYEHSPKPRSREIIILLIRNGADPEFKTPYGSAYKLANDFGGNDQTLMKDMQKARDEYLKDQKKKPSGNPKKSKSIKLKKSEEREL